MRSLQNPPQHQDGATLIVSLVILAVITILGVASMRTANLELKMASSARDRAVAFQAAESALNSAEALLRTNPFTIDQLLQSFKKDCTGGLCFSGDLQGATNKDDCRLANTANETEQIWRDSDIWDSPTTHRVIQVLTNSTENDDGEYEPVPVRYIYEFLCFVPRDDKAVDDGENNRNDGVPLYRITVRAEGDAGRSAVMLQSVYRAAE